MEFSIKKKNIKWVVIGTVLSIALVFGIGAIVKHKIDEKREAKELEEYIEKTIQREYKDLIRDYESYKETMEDYSYSRSFRWRYAAKINELVGRRIIQSEYGMYIDSDTDKEIREELRTVARVNAYKKLME